MHKYMNNKIVSSRKGKTTFALIGYYLILCMVYAFWLSPTYSYQGFSLSASINTFTIGLVTAITFSFFVSAVLERGNMSDNTLSFLMLLYFYPQIVLYAFDLNDNLYFLYVTLYCTFLIIINNNLHFQKSKFRHEERLNLFEVIIVLLGLAMVMISGAYSGFRVSFDLSDFYEYRFEVRELSMPTILKYILNWARTILPIGLTYALISKRKLLVIFTMVAQVLCFSFDGKKSALFMFVLAFAVAYLYKPEHMKKIPAMMCLLCGLVFVEKILRDGDSFVGKHIIRRMMFVPPYLGWAYYDYFSHNELDLLRSSILRWVGFKSPYEEQIPRLIGRLYYTSSSTGAVNANTGLCGDAFSNFGWYSLLVYPLMNVVIFKIIDKYSEGVDERLKIIISLTIAYSFLSGSFFSVLLTNGVLLIILLLMLLPKDSSGSSKE